MDHQKVSDNAFEQLEADLRQIRSDTKVLKRNYFLYGYLSGIAFMVFLSLVLP